MSFPVEILGLIPARGGSKGVPRKNIRSLAGEPLIQHAVKSAMASHRLTRVVVTTDCPAIAEVAKATGAEVPFLRPIELAQDHTPTFPVVFHALNWLRDHQGWEPDVLVLLQPTTPLRTGRHIDEAVQLLLQSRCDSVVSVSLVPAHYHPDWQFVLDRNGKMQLFNGRTIERTTTRRQELTSTYTRNGAIYGVFRHVLEESRSLYGNSCAPYVMSDSCSVNIDTEQDWQQAEMLLRMKAD